MHTTQPIEGYYSLIQYCPDRGRAEGVNVGLLLFSPTTGRLEVRRASKLRRLRRVFGSESLDLSAVRYSLTAFVDALEADAERGRFRSLQDLQAFIDTRANEFLLTQPKGARIEDHRADLERLYRTFVATEDEETPETMLGARQLLHETFVKLRERLPSVMIGYEVNVPELDVPLKANYAYRNGRLNLVRCLELGGGEGHVVNEAMRTGFKNLFLQKHWSLDTVRPGLVLVALDGMRGVTDQPVDRIEHKVEQIATQSEARFVRSSEVEEFAREVEREAH
jgi:hypothetical protein